MIHWVLFVIWGLVSSWLLWFAWKTKEPFFAGFAVLAGLIALAIWIGIVN